LLEATSRVEESLEKVPQFAALNKFRKVERSGRGSEPAHCKWARPGSADPTIEEVGRCT
jgi:hypothetical protein